LHEDSEGVLWIGTEHGLNRFNDGRVTAFTRGQGLPDNLVNSIVEDDSGRLWIGHDLGIYWVSKDELDQVAANQRQQVRAVIYHEPGGPDVIETNGQKSNPAVCRTRDGHLWFPTTRGVLEIDPSLADLDTVTPSTVIEAVSAGGKLVWANLPSESTDYPVGTRSSMPRVFHLPPGNSRIIQVNYAANTFAAPEKARFRYRLHGLSEQWIALGTRRELHLTDLRPGDYQLEITACNHHGVWQEPGTMVGLHLAPFFYETWWFYLVAISSFSGGVALILRWRFRELRKIEDLQRVNALNEQRRRIARDVHDDLGASLTHILRLSQTDSQSPGSPVPGAAAQRIATIAEAAFDNMGEIIWANNPEFDTLEDLVAFAREHAASFLASTPLQSNLKFPEEVPAMKVNGLVRRHVLLILKEALRNVVKHARATQVNVHLNIDGHNLSLVVADNGCGLPANGGRRFGNGLINMRSRAEEIGGVLDVGSETPHGTRVSARIPLR
jgi:signal transduction histidine kinase